MDLLVVVFSYEFSNYLDLKVNVPKYCWHHYHLKHESSEIIIIINKPFIIHPINKKLIVFNN